jgi:hypothetical protein
MHSTLSKTFHCHHHMSPFSTFPQWSCAGVACFYQLTVEGQLALFTRSITTLQRYYTENSKHIFPEKELRGHSPNSYIHVSVYDLYIPTIGLHILLQENRWTDRRNI